MNSGSSGVSSHATVVGRHLYGTATSVSGGIADIVAQQIDLGLRVLAKGLVERRLLFKYPVRVAMNPFFSTVGYVLPELVSGSTIISVVLSLPTTGPLLLSALMGQDMFLAGSFVMMLSILTVIGTLISDILLAWVDPRIRYGGG